MMDNDVSDIFEARVKAARPWAFYFLGWLILVISVPIAMVIVDPATKHLPMILGILAAAVVPSIAPLARMLRCPSCARCMGRDIGEYCPLCGARIRKENATP